MTFAVKELWESLADYVNRDFIHGYSRWSMAYRDTHSAPEHLIDIEQDLIPLLPHLYLIADLLLFTISPPHIFWPGGLFRVQDLVTAYFSQSGSAQSGDAGLKETKGLHSLLISEVLFFCFVSLLMTKKNIGAVYGLSTYNLRVPSSFLT